MRKLFFMLCATLSFSVASAQTDKTVQTTEVKQTTVKSTDVAKSGSTTKNKTVSTKPKKMSVANDSTALINPTDAPAEGSNSRNPSRNNTYNTKKDK